MIQKVTSLLVVLAFSTPVLSFTNQGVTTSFASVQLDRSKGRFSPIFSTEPENDTGLGDDIPLPESSVTTTTSSEPEGTQYPLNVPSPILLASSMVLAIVGTGE